MGGQWPVVVNVSKRILCAAAFEISVSAGTDEAQRRTRLVDPSDGSWRLVGETNGRFGWAAKDGPIHKEPYIVTG